jgi:hypothetical protein
MFVFESYALTTNAKLISVNTVRPVDDSTNR